MNRPLLIPLAAFAGLVGCSAPRVAPRPPAPPPAAVAPLGDETTDLLARVQALGLRSSPGAITVYYDEGHHDKAVRLRDLVARAGRFYGDSLGIRADLSLAVLTRGTWDRLVTWQPYGIPGVAGEPAVAFLPATDDNVAADDALSIRSGVSAATVRVIESSGHSYDEGARRYVDLVGLHELGHTYAQAYGIRAPNHWLNELVATYFAYSFMRSREPEMARLWDGVLTGYVEAVSPEHRTLEDFDRLYFGVGPRNYVWYQSRFQEQVAAVYAAEGLGFIRDLRDAFGPTAAPAPSQAEVLRTLERLAPGFEAWASRMR